MSMRETLALAAALAVGLSLANAADAPRFGQPIAPGDLAPWDISIAPDGVGLPPGSGTPAQGATVYAERGCALCHGEKGARRTERSAGRRRSARQHRPRSGQADRQLLALCHDHLRLHPSRDAVASPKTLTDDEVYALTAYILALNKIIGENDVMNAETLPKVKMPNRDGFISKYPEKH